MIIDFWDYSIAMIALLSGPDSHYERRSVNPMNKAHTEIWRDVKAIRQMLTRDRIEATQLKNPRSKGDDRGGFRLAIEMKAAQKAAIPARKVTEMSVFGLTLAPANGVDRGRAAVPDRRSWSRDQRTPRKLRQVW